MKKLKNILDVTTNVVVVVFAVVAIVVLAKNYLLQRGPEPRADIQKGSVFPEIAGADYKQAPRTLILTLNVDCRYCSKSIPFYYRLAEARRENGSQFNIIAAFINKEEDRVKSYAREKHLSVQTIARVDPDKLNIQVTPTLVLVDGAGKVLDSWRGVLQPDGEREVFDALGLPYKPEAGSTSTAANIKKTTDIFDQQKVVLSLRPVDNPQNDPRHLVEVFDVNGKGEAYVIYDKFMFQYDANGELKNTRPLPTDFRSPFCVDDGGNIYAASEGGVSVYSPELVKVRDVALGDLLPGGARTLKMTLDRRREWLYVPDYGFGEPARAYTGSPLEIPAAPPSLKVFDALL